MNYVLDAPSRPSWAAILLTIFGALTIVAGVLIALGAADRDSEVGQLGHHLVLGPLFVLLGCLYITTSRQLRRSRPNAHWWARATGAALAFQVVVRLTLFGRIGVGDVIAVCIIAAGGFRSVLPPSEPTDRSRLH